MLLARTRALPNTRQRVGLVGHNPGLGELATALTGSGAELEVRRLGRQISDRRRCSAMLDFSVRRSGDVERNSALLALYLTPAELEADADQA